jgi:uncharacterized coiled-coil protein SlyX
MRLVNLLLWANLSQTIVSTQMVLSHLQAALDILIDDNSTVKIASREHTLNNGQLMCTPK